MAPTSPWEPRLGEGEEALAPFSLSLHYRGAYLLNRTLWSMCVDPPQIVSWNVTLFSLLVGASCLEIVLCGVQLVNAIIGVFCGDCRKKEVGQCGGRREAAEGPSLLPGCVLTASFPQGAPH